MKNSYPTCDIRIGATTYHVHLRVQPGRDAPHVGADSPRHMKPGSRPRVSIIRILRDQEDVGETLLWTTRVAIDREVARMAARGLLYPGAGSPPSPAPSFEDAERLR
jgi:hypothetical protein